MPAITDYNPADTAQAARQRAAGMAGLRRQASGGNGGGTGTGRTARLQGFKAQWRSELTDWNGQPRRMLDGYASVVEMPYEMYDFFGIFTEEVAADAFDKTLKASPDVAFLVNHRGITMARTTKNSLELDADPRGLHMRAYVNPERTDVRDITTAIDDGEVDEMSFAFWITDGEWNEDYDEFRILEVDLDRGDVSAVNYGANPYTSIEARAPMLLEELEHLPAAAQRAAADKLARILNRGQAAADLSQRGRAARSRAADPAARIEALRERTAAARTADADESVTSMIAALDAVLDQATDLIATGDPADQAQAMGLVLAAEVIADQLMELLGIPDPDDEPGETGDPAESGQDPMVGPALYEADPGITRAQDSRGMSVEYYETLLTLDER